jgi:hypothetical protein
MTPGKDFAPSGPVQMFFQSQSPGAFTQSGMPVPCIVLHCIYTVLKIIFAPIVPVLHTSLVDGPLFAVGSLDEGEGIIFAHLQARLIVSK